MIATVRDSLLQQASFSYPATPGSLLFWGRERECGFECRNREYSSPLALLSLPSMKHVAELVTEDLQALLWVS